MNTRCETDGCFNTAYDSKLCSQCLDGRLPMARGPVTQRELMQARHSSAADRDVTRQRLVANGQPTEGLDAE